MIDWLAGTGFKLPKSAEQVLTAREKQIQAQLDASRAAATQVKQQQTQQSTNGGSPSTNAAPADGKSQCFLLQNMFNPQL